MKEWAEGQNKLFKEYQRLVPEQGRGEVFFREDEETDDGIIWTFVLRKEEFRLKYSYKNKKIKISSKILKR